METATHYLAIKAALLNLFGQSEPMMFTQLGLALYLVLLALLGSRQALRPASILIALLVAFDVSATSVVKLPWQPQVAFGHLAVALIWPCLFSAVAHHRRQRWLNSHDEGALSAIDGLPRARPIRTVKLPPDVGGELIYGRFRVITGRG